MEGVTEGRNVHYVMQNGQHRAAFIVRAWNTYDEGMVNLTVLLDGDNDAHPATLEPGAKVLAPGLLWVTSVHYSEDTTIPRTWHWIERA